MTWFLDALATWRLTRLVTRDTFPPVEVARYRLMASDAPESVKYLAECPWCISFWLALAVQLARRVVPRTWAPVAIALGYSGLVGLLEERID